MTRGDVLTKKFTHVGSAGILRRSPTSTQRATSSARSLVFRPDSLRDESVGEQRMTRAFNHVPVLEAEVLAAFRSIAPGVIIDATLGGAGHASAILSMRDDLGVLGIDRDPIARLAAAERLAPFGDRARVVAGTFSNLTGFVQSERQWIAGREVVGVFADLGVSSPQLDDVERGFSFRADAPLDMRMDGTSGMTAAEYIASVELDELRTLLREHGEDKFAHAIAKSILARKPQTTSELVAAVEVAVPMAARRRGNVATRAFQALRVAINEEVRELNELLDSAVDVLSVGGVLAVISYHSGEDRATKEFLKFQATGGCTCPVILGCVCGAVVTMTTRKGGAIVASDDELARNPRSRSARMRLGVKVLA
jgi:16S rRNA (cytosine1402-N4)-methyltransferase